MKLIVNNMSCGHCVKTVTKAIQSIDSAAKVDVDLAKKEVAITGNVSLEAAIKAINDAGFEYVKQA
ncbi:heavy-metal-associated domain-containing protein [Zophobihabitans entericus]|nr:heavy-metal-associated domain-containing protein [Zophobihabitans entericus]